MNRNNRVLPFLPSQHGGYGVSTQYEVVPSEGEAENLDAFVALGSFLAQFLTGLSLPLFRFFASVLN